MTDKSIIIGDRKVGNGQPPFVIAELSANHNGDIARAFEIMEAIKEAGADAVKLQTYRADTITIQSDRKEFLIESGLWKGRTLSMTKPIPLGNGMKRYSIRDESWD